MKPFVEPKKENLFNPSIDPDLMYSFLKHTTDPSIKTGICINTIRARANWVMVNGKWVKRTQCETYKRVK